MERGAQVGVVEENVDKARVRGCTVLVGLKFGGKYHVLS
jgi:hypothetical protein